MAHTEVAMCERYDTGPETMSLKVFCEVVESLVPRELYNILEQPASREAAQGDFFGV